MFRILHRGLMEVLRDRMALFFMILFPSVLVFILGTMLSSMDNADASIETIDIRYTIEADASETRTLILSFIENAENNDALSFEEAHSDADARKAVREGDADVALRFETPLAVEIYEGRDTIKNQAIWLIIESFSRRYAALSAVAEKDPSMLPTAQAAAETADDLMESGNLGVSRSMIDYYAVAMIVMILVMGSSIGAAEDIYNGRRDFTLARSLASPKGRASFYLQTLIAKMPQNIIQVLTIMLVSSFIFGAHYAKTIPDNLLLFAMLFLCGMAMSAVATIIGIVIKVSPTAAIMPAAWIMLFFSGTFSKEVVIVAIADFNPFYRIQKAAFELTIFGRHEQCVAVIIVAAAILTLAAVIGALLFRRKGFSA